MKDIHALVHRPTRLYDISGSPPKRGLKLCCDATYIDARPILTSTQNNWQYWFAFLFSLAARHLFFCRHICIIDDGASRRRTENTRLRARRAYHSTTFIIRSKQFCFDEVYIFDPVKTSLILDFQRTDEFL